MATKADLGRNVALTFFVSGSTRTVLFDRVRNWKLSGRREVIDATNNDSGGWRELVISYSTENAGNNMGQREVTLECEAVYDVSTVGFGGVTDRAQWFDRKEVMRQLNGNTALGTFHFYLGSTTQTVTPSGWGVITPVTASAGYITNVTVGGTYDDPVLFDLRFLLNARPNAF